MVADRGLPAADLGRAAAQPQRSLGHHQLAPSGFLGQFLALWFLATSVGTTVGGQIARVTDANPVLAFAVCGGMALAFGVVMFLASRSINRLMAHVH